MTQQHQFAAQKIQQGALQEATSLCQEMLKTNPGDTNALVLLGHVALRHQQYDEALKYCAEALRITKDNPAIFELAAQIFEGQGKPVDAAQSFRDAGTVTLQRPNAFENPQLIQQAEGFYRRALAHNPNLVDARFNLAICLTRQHKNEECKQELEKVLALDPDHIDARMNLANICNLLDEQEQALKHCDRIIRDHPEAIRAYGLKALILENMNLLEEAREILNQGFERAPDNNEILYPLAKLEWRAGNLDAAADAYRRIIDIHGGGPHITYELAKVTDKKGDYDEAFRLFEECQRKWEQMPEVQQLSPAVAFEQVELYRQFFTKERVRSWKQPGLKDNFTAPIFLVGFPRSGTTLTEQILSSHPNITGTQESYILHNVANTHLSPYPEALGNLKAEDITRLRQAYLDESAKLLKEKPEPGIRLLDKLPLNILHLPLIYRLFPDAKILVALRDPRDVCLSCFMQLFGPNISMRQFTSLESAIHYYTAVMDLYLHYRDILPSSPFLEFRYEDMIEDVEGYARKFLDFIDEPWDPAVLEYHEKDRNRHVRTPSYEGVMEPVYQTSAGRWKNYQSHFKPHLEKLQPFLEKFGYELE